MKRIMYLIAILLLLGSITSCNIPQQAATPEVTSTLEPTPEAITEVPADLDFVLDFVHLDDQIIIGYGTSVSDCTAGLYTELGLWTGIEAPCSNLGKDLQTAIDFSAITTIAVGDQVQICTANRERCGNPVIVTQTPTNLTLIEANGSFEGAVYPSIGHLCGPSTESDPGYHIVFSNAEIKIWRSTNGIEWISKDFDGSQLHSERSGALLEFSGDTDDYAVTDCQTHVEVLKK